MRRFALVIEYDGTNYCGWQIQPNGTTVQQMIQDAFKKCFGVNIILIASGRTDSGVHAKGQVAHFDCETQATTRSIQGGLNSFLPQDIAIKKCTEVCSDFHARYGVLKKVYTYAVLMTKVKSPLEDRFAVGYRREVDDNALIAACRLLEGRHDFGGFCAVGGSVRETIRQLYSVGFVRNGDKVTFTFIGNGFLYNMVRILVGTLLDIGCGKKDISILTELFEKKDRSLAGKTMPAKGLCLERAEYSTNYCIGN